MSKRYSKDWVSSNTDIWIKVLGHLRGVKATGLEIGSFEGRSASFFLDNILTHKESTLTCVDIWKSWPRTRFDQNTKEYGSKVRVREASSLGYLSRRVGQGLRSCYDFVYVDGDHNACTVLADAILSWILLKEGGVAIFDDCSVEYENENKHRQICPRVALEAFMMSRPEDFQILHRGNQIVLKKTPPKKLSKPR